MEQTNKGNNKMKYKRNKKREVKEIMERIVNNPSYGNGKIVNNVAYGMISPMVRYTMEQMEKMSLGAISNLSVLIGLMETTNKQTKETK